jgi:phosphoribosylanthranilate isomerase
MLKTKVKASSITNLTDARYFAAWEAQWLGFCLNPNAPEYIEPRAMKAIKEWVDGVKILGEFDMQTAEDMATAIDMLELEGIQVGMFTEAATLIDLQATIPVFKEIVPAKEATSFQLEAQLEPFTPYVTNYLLQFEKAGITWADIKQGHSITINELHALCANYPLYISMSIPADELDDFLQQVQPTGLSVKGGEEEKVGYKSFDELDDWFEALETFAE